MNCLTQGSRSHFSHILLRACISHTFVRSQGKSAAHRQALACQTRWLFALAGLQEDGGDTTLGPKEKKGSWGTLNEKLKSAWKQSSMPFWCVKVSTCIHVCMYVHGIRVWMFVWVECTCK